MKSFLYLIVLAICTKFNNDSDFSRREDSINWYPRHSMPRATPLNWEDKPMLRESIHSHRNNEEEYRGFASPVILRRVHYTIPLSRPEHAFYPSESLRDAVRGNKEAPSEEGWSISGIIFFIISLAISGAVGFYFGKIQESKNYVRVPSTN